MTTALIGETFTAIVEAPFGAIGIRTEAGQLHELTYLPPQYQAKAPRDALNKDIVRQVSAYLANPDYPFTVSLPEVGTAHQRKVWAVIQSIPRGEVLTYAQVAREIGSAPRAVGQACGANWYPVLIPCHRVVAAGGIGGFARHDGGFHLGVKRWLLAHEGVSGF
jgi:methylated-DNA-[protein]-cysteine S-methyltransferase